MGLLTKIKSSALQYTLVSSVWIAIIIFAVLTLVYLQKKIEIKNSFHKQSIGNINLGFSFLSVNPIGYNATKTFNFSTNILEKTTILKRKWGVFDLVVVSSFVKKQTSKKAALMGTVNSSRKALYLSDNNKPLVLTGNSKIAGDVFLPKSGVKSGYINGKSYQYNKLIFGKKFTSNHNLPEIFSLDTILYKNIYEFEEKNNNLIFGIQTHKIVQSFLDPIQSFHFSKPIKLEHIHLVGHQCVYSKKSIIVSATATLEDVILIAPSITIEDGTKGNFQAFASQKITVGKHCKLQYPSALVINTVLEKSKTPKETPLYIDKETIIKGPVVYHASGFNNQARFIPQVFLSPTSTIIGEVYCNKNLELLGNVYGSVITENFITKQSGSIYVNSIFNGQINSSKLPEQYCGLSIKNTSKLNVAKWLY